VSRSRSRAGIAAVAVWLAGCASAPLPPVSDVSLYDDDSPVLLAGGTPLIESPPIEPVEPVETPPAPERAAPPVARPDARIPSPGPAPQPAPLLQAPQLPTPVVAPAALPASAAPTQAASPPPTILASAAPSTLPDVPALPVEDLAALTLIADLQRFGGLSADDAKRELAAATAALTRERSDANRVRLAVLYTLVRSSPQDDQRALQLLENVAKSGGGVTPIKGLAAVLQAQIGERIRTVREEQQKANDAVQKLEALRAMERSLLRDRVRSGGGGGGGGGGSGGGSGGR
jgi:hypothetical protein